MEKILEEYPMITRFISGLSQAEDTFLYDRFANSDYGFWPHLEYFLENLRRFPNCSPILKRLSVVVPMSMDMEKAWGEWRKFRSAQSEVTTIFLIENYFAGRILEIIPENRTPSPDLKIKLSEHNYMLEIKAQSGQQHGDKHPRLNGGHSFDPKFEEDLKSWLFMEKISSRSGKPMKPKVLEAEEKGSDILVAMTDFFATIDEIQSKVSYLSPNSTFIDKKAIQIESGNLLKAHFYQVKFPVNRKLHILKEIWLYDESHLDNFLVLFEDSMLLLDHLRTKT